MNKVLYVGKKPVKSVFFNSIEIYKDPIRRVKADFVNQVYKQNGEDKTFSELFDFSRAGKAWLVEDTGLQEYAIDVPRFENGLLIEEGATNYWLNYIVGNADRSASLRMVEEDSFLLAGKACEVEAINRFGYRYQIIEESTSIVFYLKPLSKTSVIGTSTSVTNPLWMRYDLTTETLQEANGVIATVSKWKDWYKVTASNVVSTRIPQIVGFSGNPGTPLFLTSTVQVEKHPQGRVSSYIHTEKTTTTRPPEFLSCKEPLHKVTGDWDDTLDISIVNGQLTHTGYGYIRTMEIEYV